MTGEAQEYLTRTGENPGAALTDDQKARLEQLRAQEIADYERQSAQFAASPEGQQQAAMAAQAEQDYQAREQRLRESQERAERNMGQR
jgi:hypothetical protein